MGCVDSECQFCDTNNFSVIQPMGCNDITETTIGGETNQTGFMYNCGKIKFTYMPLILMIPWIVCGSLLWLLFLVCLWNSLRKSQKKSKKEIKKQQKSRLTTLYTELEPSESKTNSPTTETEGNPTNRLNRL